jgi:hypothetical protein
MLFQQDILTGKWSLYNLPEGGPKLTPAEAMEVGELIYDCDRVAKAAAWLVRNQLCGPDLEILVADSFELTTEMIEGYVRTLEERFPPIEFYNLDTETIWHVGAKGYVVLAFNLEDPSESKLRTLDLVYRTGWGEMRHQCKDLAGLMAEADKYLELGAALYEACGPVPVTSLVLHPAQADTFNRAFLNLKAALMAHMRPRHQGRVSSKSLIDL